MNQNRSFAEHASPVQAADLVARQIVRAFAGMYQERPTWWCVTATCVVKIGREVNGVRPSEIAGLLETGNLAVKKWIVWVVVRNRGYAA